MSRPRVDAQPGEYVAWLENPTTQAFFSAVNELLDNKVSESSLRPESADLTLSLSSQKEGYIQGVRAVLALKAKIEQPVEVAKPGAIAGRFTMPENY